MNRSTRRVRVVYIRVTFHPARMVTSRAHNASELYNCCRSYTFIIVPFNCDLTQHLNRPDARTRVRERGRSFSQSPKFHIFIICRNLRSKIKNRLPKRFCAYVHWFRNWSHRLQIPSTIWVINWFTRATLAKIISISCDSFNCVNARIWINYLSLHRATHIFTDAGTMLIDSRFILQLV